MSRLPVIDLAQLPPMQVLETIDTEAILVARMARLKALWALRDPPAAAQYDVELLEFDPIKINQEASTYFELLLRDRVNQAARAITLAFGTGTDLDAIASRYPGGVPRLPNESDVRYQRRIWLSSNLLSPHGVFEAYVFWALTADPTLHDATATAIPGSGQVKVTIMAEGTNPIPTAAQRLKVFEYITTESRKGLTDDVSVLFPKVTNTKYRIRYWAFPGVDIGILETDLKASLAKLIENQRWLGYDHTRLAIDAALALPGLYNAIIDEPEHDVLVDANGVVKVQDVKLTFKGRGE